MRELRQFIVLSPGPVILDKPCQDVVFTSSVFADHSDWVIREREVVECLLATNPRRKKITPTQPSSQGSRKKKYSERERERQAGKGWPGTKEALFPKTGSWYPKARGDVGGER